MGQSTCLPVEGFSAAAAPGIGDDLGMAKPGAEPKASKYACISATLLASSCSDSKRGNKTDLSKVRSMSIILVAKLRLQTLTQNEGAVRHSCVFVWKVKRPLRRQGSGRPGVPKLNEETGPAS